MGSATQLHPPASRSEADDFRAVFETMPVGAFRVDAHGRILDANAALARMLGHDDRRAIVGRPLAALRSHPGMSWPDFCRRVKNGGQEKGLETVWTRQDGVAFLARENVWSAQVREGGFVIEGTVLDVTGRKADEAVRVLSAVFESMPVGVIQTDLEGRILQANRAFHEIVGASESSLGRLSYSELATNGEREKSRKRIQALAQGEMESLRVERSFKRPDGRRAWLQETWAVVRDAHRRPRYLNAVVEDITQRKDAEAHAAERTQELEAVNAELSSFAYTVSHDLRAPLRAVQGYGAMLLDGKGDALGEDGRGLVERMRANASRMAQMIDDLLALSRVTRAGLVVRPVSLTTLAHDVVDRLRDAHSGRSVRVRIQPRLKAHGDAGLLRLVLHNLLENAWKFTSHRSQASIELASERSDDGSTVYVVRDNGAGFDMAHAGKLFRPFERLHPTGAFAGTGIGLATVQRIVERHGGKIWAVGEPGAGATFYFTLGAPG